MIIYYLIYYIN